MKKNNHKKIKPVKEIPGTLPEAFTDAMRELLGDKAELFFEAYDHDNHLSLRINQLKVNGRSQQDAGGVIEKVFPTATERVKWEECGRYYLQSDEPGRHPLHNAGAYYIQEASAMAPVFFLDPMPGECVLDLCAAPGGKTTQIASHMKGRGLLVCNEIVPKRARILSENVERMCVPNAVVVNETPQRLAECFEGRFDRILVDAPCSGEGMFRKHPEVIFEWSPENVLMCAQRQAEILDMAGRMLKSGGRIVYSTCTFSESEDEECIRSFLERNPDFEPFTDERQRGVAITDFNMVSRLDGTYRLFPHMLKGEGHFLAVLQKKGNRIEENSLHNTKQRFPDALSEFAETVLSDKGRKRLEELFDAGWHLENFKERICIIPGEISLSELNGIKTERIGLEIGTLERERFEPAHALALYLSPEDVLQSRELSKDEAQSYLKGMTVNGGKTDKGWVLICHEGCSLGWAKCSVSGSGDAMLKNHYPKGLRLH